MGTGALCRGGRVPWLGGLGPFPACPGSALGAGLGDGQLLHGFLAEPGLGAWLPPGFGMSWRRVGASGPPRHPQAPRGTVSRKAQPLPSLRWPAASHREAPAPGSAVTAELACPPSPPPAPALIRLCLSQGCLVTPGAALLWLGSLLARLGRWSPSDPQKLRPGIQLQEQPWVTPAPLRVLPKLQLWASEGRRTLLLCVGPGRVHARAPARPQQRAGRARSPPPRPHLPGRWGQVGCGPGLQAQEASRSCPEYPSARLCDSQPQGAVCRLAQRLPGTLGAGISVILVYFFLCLTF